MLKTITGNDSGNATVDCIALPNYQKLTTDNFIVEFVSCPAGNAYDGSVEEKRGGATGTTMSKSYNPLTGTLTISGLKQHTGPVHTNGDMGKNFVQKFTCRVYYA